MSSSSSSGGAASARDGCRSYGARDVFSTPSINIALLRSERDSTCVETLARQFALLLRRSLVSFSPLVQVKTQVRRSGMRKSASILKHDCATPRQRLTWPKKEIDTPC